MSTNNQIVSIKRPEPGISPALEDMYLNERLVDVTLSCCNGQLQAHKLVLAASSTYFSSLFDKLPNPFHYPVIFIKDIQIEDLRLIVDFMYKGQLTLNRDRLAIILKSAENLQISGLSAMNETIPNSSDIINSISINGRISNSRSKRNKKSVTNPINHLGSLSRNYTMRFDQDDNNDISSQSDKLLEQSMIVAEDPLDIGNSSLQFSYGDSMSSRNLNNQQLHTPSPSSISHQNISTLDSDHLPQSQQLNNQLQVLSHSLAANRSSMSISGANNNGNNTSQLSSQQSSRSRVHSCNICWKTFRERANLKRHLQVHSLDRVVYACPDCNKTFSWKDNYIRHTKTAHHMNNLKQST